MKGANLFALWLGAAHRPTRDLDLLGRGSDEIEPMVAVFQAICRQEVEDDGLIFEADSVSGGPIRDNARYGGLRLTLRAWLGKALIPVQIDIGFGDIITPAAQEMDFPASLNLPSARLLTYPRETVVAEKCEALIDLGLGNSRLKDFYDLWHLASHFDFEGLLLCEAIAATLQRRGTTLPILPPAALTDAFSDDPARRRQSSAFLEKNEIPVRVELDTCILLLRGFLLPLLTAIRDQSRLSRWWRHENLEWQQV